MPRYVDHDERRRELVEIAAHLVAAGGAEAATVRAIASAAGFSTKVVSHFFADKRALMLLTYRYAANRSEELTTASQPAQGGDILAFLRALLPIHPEVERNWRVWFAFWGRAIADPELAAEQKLRAAQIVERIGETLGSDPGYAHLSDDARGALAAHLFSTLIGVAMQAVFDPQAWPPERQVAVLRQTLPPAKAA